jgi:hypothetical protein
VKTQTALRELTGASVIMVRFTEHAHRQCRLGLLLASNYAVNYHHTHNIMLGLSFVLMVYCDSLYSVRHFCPYREMGNLNCPTAPQESVSICSYTHEEISSACLSLFGLFVQSPCVCTAGQQQSSKQLGVQRAGWLVLRVLSWHSHVLKKDGASWYVAASRQALKVFFSFCQALITPSMLSES